MVRYTKIFILITSLLIVLTPAYSAPKKKSKKEQEKPIKHYIDVYGGGGMSSLGYGLDGGKTGIDGSFTIGAGYTWFFLPYMGLQTGLSVTRVAEKASLSESMSWNTNKDGSPLVDYMGDAYIHRTAINEWKESQQAYLLQIPIGLRWRWFKDKDSRVGLHAGLGFNLSIPVLSSYHRNSGAQLTHTGWYENWQLVLHDLPGRFMTEDYTSAQEESLGSKVSTVNVMGQGEIGMSIRVNKRSELYVAAYGQYMLNNFSGVKNAERIALGFANSENKYSFMEEYTGLIGTDKVGAMHPWVAGIKVGYSIWPGKTDQQKKKELKKLAKQFPDVLPPKLVHDTLIIHDTVSVHDTVFIHEHDTVTIVAPKESTEHIVYTTEAERSMDMLLSEAVIWFELDSYKPILEPAYILDSVAAMMAQHPQLMIHINGHACEIGPDMYNKRLALKRALAVSKILQKKGVSPKRMFVWSYGEKQPYHYNAEHQLSKDRRVEIIIHQK